MDGKPADENVMPASDRSFVDMELIGGVDEYNRPWDVARMRFGMKDGVKPSSFAPWLKSKGIIILTCDDHYEDLSVWIRNDQLYLILKDQTSMVMIKPEYYQFTTGSCSGRGNKDLVPEVVEYCRSFCMAEKQEYVGHPSEQDVHNLLEQRLGPVLTRKHLMKAYRIESPKYKPTFMNFSPTIYVIDSHIAPLHPHFLENQCNITVWHCVGGELIKKREDDSTSLHGNSGMDVTSYGNDIKLMSSHGALVVNTLLTLAPRAEVHFIEQSEKTFESLISTLRAIPNGSWISISVGALIGIIL
jgi:hypothetical protein